MVIEKYLMTENGVVYMQNNYRPFEQNRNFVDINGVSLGKKDRSGPSSPYGNTFIKYDFVLGFKCDFPDLINKWIKRPRHYKWPDQSTIRRVSLLQGHVVPVADKGSKNPQTEWRICYTRAELLLLESLNEVQIKLYILLKHIAKSVLKPLCSEISSYIMKNIVLWMVELNPPDSFLQSQLIERVTGALVYLKDCLSSNELRSYMIDERNLFEGRITEDERCKLLTVLDILINEKEDVLQRCDKIRSGLNNLKEFPECFIKEGENRDEIEQLILHTNVIFKETETPFEEKENIQIRLKQNALYKKYKEELCKLVIPDRERIVQLGQNFEEIYRKRLFVIVSLLSELMFRTSYLLLRDETEYR